MENDRYNADDQVGATAVEWYGRLRSPELSADHAAEFESWLRADPAHAEAYNQVDDLWRGLEAVSNSADVHAARAYADRFRAEARLNRRRRRIFSHAGSWATRRGVRAAAAVAMLVLAVGLGVTSFPLQQGNQYRTALGEQREVALADGSTMLLNTLTTIEVAYSAAERRVLLQDGQAAFDVEADPMRPFIVVAGEEIIRALGTEFEVRKSGDKVTVTLLEGKVAVHKIEPVVNGDELLTASRGPIARPVAELNPGEQVSIASDGPATAQDGGPAVTKVDIARATAWRHGKIDLYDTPLRTAIADVNRYSRTKILLSEDEGLGDLRVSGVFVAGRSEDFADALRGYFSIEVYRFGDRIVLKAPSHT